MQTRARFGFRKAVVLPIKDDAPLIWRNVPAWEDLPCPSSEYGRFLHNVPARESRREGPSRLPAGTPEAFSARKGDSLPRRDVVQTWARFGASRAEILPSKDDVPGMTHNVPAWESSSGWTHKPLPSQDNVRAQATQRPGSGELPTTDAPGSSESRRCSYGGCTSSWLE